MANIHTKVRFWLHRLPIFPVRYYLPLENDGSEIRFWWSCVLPSIHPESHALDFRFHGWDAAELILLNKLKDELRCFWDIGAHHGLYSVLLGMLSDGRIEIHAFEPGGSSRRRIKLNGWMNRVNNIQTHPEVVGDKDGEVQFAVPKKAHGTIGHVVSNEEPLAAFRVITTRSISLDAWIAKSGTSIPDLIKIDVEGHESALLRGAAGLLEKGETAWIFEVLDHERDGNLIRGGELISHFRTFPGVKVFHILGDGSLEVAETNTEHPYTHLCNYLAVPTNNPAWSARLDRLLAHQ